MGRFPCIHLVLGLSMVSALNAQNLVVNGGFESYTMLPNGAGQTNKGSGWNNVNLNYTNWPYASPDYFHTSSAVGSGVNVPWNTYGYLNAHTGNGIMGFIARHNFQANFREYLSSQLASPMVVGETYTVSFYLNNATDQTAASGKRRYYGSSSTNIGVRFSLSPFAQAVNVAIGGTPHVVVPGQPWSTDWVLYSFTYVCTSPWQYITIGNFSNDASTSTTIMDPVNARYPTGAYYFIDDVSVEAYTTLPIELISFAAEHRNEVVELDWTTASERNNDYFTIERSTDLVDWKVITTVPGAGNSASSLNYGAIDHWPLRGTSYYRLKQTDFDGSTSYSGVRAVVVDSAPRPIIHPNPSTGGSIFLSMDRIDPEVQVVHVQLYDMRGALAGQQAIAAADGTFNTALDLGTSLPDGVYMVRITAGTQIYTERLVVRH